jgi:hypothetical protein
MAHGVVNAVHTRESGPRGASGSVGTGMVMLMGRRSLSRGAFAVRAMATAEPAMGAEGYPLLLQTGETADGMSVLVDRQHPHDMVMELAVSWSRTFDSGDGMFLYGGPVGEPPIGPPAFMHRGSALGSPFPPIGHHFLDATHVTHGVVTFGYVAAGGLKLEVGAFNGHEPDQRRWGLQPPRLNSAAGRVTINPGPNWSSQVSLAYLDSPEQLHPGLDALRVTASVAYNRPLAGGHWQTMAAWGRNKRMIPFSATAVVGTTDPSSGHVHYIPTDGSQPVEPQTIQNAVLLETTANVTRRHTLHARFEAARKDELFPPSDPRHAEPFVVTRTTIGYVFELPAAGLVRAGLGVSASVAGVPGPLEAAYGESPRGASVFLRLLFDSGS